MVTVLASIDKQNNNARNVNFSIPVNGDAMAPKYSAGSIVICKPINDLSFLQWGRVFCIETRTQGMIVRRIEQGEPGNNIVCVADNPDYSSFILPISEITSLAMVIGGFVFD